MERAVKKIHDLLLKRGKTLSVAESCTGGLLSNLLTYISGSSRYFLLGVTAYSNRAKEHILGIPPRLIARQGAVSGETASLMSKRVRKLSRSDFGIAVTGIAGPGGSSAGKPVGTVFIAIDGSRKKICQKFIFKGSRAAIRKKSALKALELLSRIL